MSEQSARAELVDACYREGRAMFPAVVWDAESFAAGCERRWSARSAAGLSELLGTGNGRAEEFLVVACLADRPGAAATLEREYLSRLVARVRGVCKSAHVADEALQALREKLLLPPDPKLAAYENRGHLSAWLAIVAMRTALDVSRRAQQGTLRLTALHEDLVTNALSPESQCATRELDAALRLAMRDAVRRLPDKQRFALKMQLVAGWSIDQIGRSLQTHRATAARWLVLAREQVEADVRRALVDGLGLSAAEVDGALGAMRSRLELRMSQVFQSSEKSRLSLRSADRGQ